MKKKIFRRAEPGEKPFAYLRQMDFRLRPKQVWGVMKSDTTRIFHSVVAIVILFGLCVVPCLYAWFNIFSNWDPYGVSSTSRIRVAVTSMDKGSSLLGLELNLGDQVVEALEANDSIGWVFVDSTNEALELVRSGDCYAALVIPKEFSQNVADIIGMSFEHPQLLYYENEKKNAIAPKITGKAKTAVQDQVNATFIKTIMTDVGVVLNILDANGVNYKSAVLGAADDIRELSETVEELATLLDSVAELAASGSVTLEYAANFMDNVTATLDSIGEMNGAISDRASSIAERLRGAVADMSGNENWTDDLSAALKEAGLVISEYINTYSDTLLPTVISALEEMETSLSNAAAAVDRAGDIIYGLSPTLTEDAADLANAQEDLHNGAEKMREALPKLQEAAETLDALAESEYLEQLVEALTGNTDNISAYFASPIQMTTTVLYPVDNYGSVMAPFYTVLAQWVGALFCAALLKARVRKQDYPEQLSLPEEFIGRFALFFTICMIQALVTALGDLYYVGIYCVHPGLFILGCCATGLCFALINYALLYSLEKIGLGASVIIMVVQVAGSGGSYPVDVLPQIFKILYPFMPFNYAMNALREAVAGTYGNYYAHDLLMLMLTGLLFFVLGLALYYPVHWLNKMIADSAEKTEIML